MSDTAHNGDTAADTVKWPPPADALYSDCIWLLQHDPERYFKEYLRVDFC